MLAFRLGLSRLIALCFAAGAASQALAQVPAAPAAAASAPESVLPTVRARATAEQRYRAEPAGTATRVAVPLQELPRSVQSYGEALIRDVQPQTITDIVTLAPNVTNLGSNDGRENNYVIRGFGANYGFNGIVVDGFRFRRTIANPETFNLERIDVLKGSDSLLYGANDPGGFISLTSKRPQGTPASRLELELSSFGGVSGKADLGGRLGADGGLRYRVVAVASHDPGWRDFDSKARRLFLAPSLTAELGAQRRLTVFLEHTDDRKPNDMGTAIDDQGRPVGPLERVNTHPAEVFTTDQTVLGADYAQPLAPGWSFEAHLRHQRNGYDYGEIWLPLAYAAPNYIRVPANQSLTGRDNALQLAVKGDVQWMQMRHRLAAGIDVSRATELLKGCFDPTTQDLLDFAAPVYRPNVPACDTTVLPNTIDYGASAPDVIKRLGVFVADTITLGQGLNLTLGLRHEHHEQLSGGSSYSAALKDDVLLPQVGASYELGHAATVYGSYSHSFTPSASRDAAGNLLPAETGRGGEIGLRTRWLDGRLRATAAIFSITKHNVAVADPNNPLASMASGRQQSRGLEFELRGAVTPRLDVVAALGLLDTEDKALDPGKQLINAPKVSASAWLNWRFAPGWAASAGLKHVGSRYASSDNSVQLPAYTVLNLGAEFSSGPWGARLAVQNAADKAYIESAWGGTARSVYAGTPRKLVLTTRYEF